MNEIGRVVIRITEEGSPSGLGCLYVGVAIDDDGQSKSATALSGSPDYAYSLIGRACDGRGVETVDGTLKVCGKKVTPEAYLKLWRQAIAEAVDPQIALDVLGIKVALVVRGNSIKQAGMSRQVTTDTVGSFDGWAAKYSRAMTSDADGYFSFGLGLEEEGAYSAWSFMNMYADHNDKDPRNKGFMLVSLVAPAAAQGAGLVGSEPQVTAGERGGSQVSLFD